MSDQPGLTVIVAAYNEAGVIEDSLRRIAAELDKRSGQGWELLCVDDGSTDPTGGIMDRFSEGMDKVRVIHHRRNYGQGRALRSGFAASRGAVVVTLDADLSYGPENIWNLVDALQKENVEIALASPYMKGGTVRNVPFHRKILSRLGNFYLARMSHYKISTSTCVVRAYRREVLDGMFLASDGMELQLEILMKASIAGFRVCEVPAGLEWADEKAAGAGFRRASKMKILRAIRLYLLLGWLSRPAYFFIILSLLLFLPGAYMAFALAYRLACAVGRHLGEGLSAAVSSGMAEVFTSYAYSVVFCGAFLLMGLQGFAFTLLLLQNKFYFEELYRQSQTRTGSGTSFRI